MCRICLVGNKIVLNTAFVTSSSTGIHMLSGLILTTKYFLYCAQASKRFQTFCLCPDELDCECCLLFSSPPLCFPPPSRHSGLPHMLWKICCTSLARAYMLSQDRSRGQHSHWNSGILIGMLCFTTSSWTFAPFPISFAILTTVGTCYPNTQGVTSNQCMSKDGAFTFYEQVCVLGEP